jgi:hypothetical protein
MAWNGSGTFNQPDAPEFPAAAGEIIRAAYYNAVIQALCAGFSNTMPRDGQAAATGDLDMGTTHKIVNLAPATSSSDAVRFDQVPSLTNLAASNGSSLVGHIAAGGSTVVTTVQAKLRDIINRNEYTTDVAFDAARIGKPNIEGTIFAAPKVTVGEGDRFGTATKDGVVVAQPITGTTGCHAFADQSILSAVTDVGTYGAFDSTVELQGAHNQNHVYSFQDRAQIRQTTTGVLQNSIGFYSSTVHSGPTSILSRIGMMIDQMAITGVGTITSQIGILINALTTGANNVALNIAQAVGWAIYAGGGAKSYLGGQLGLGAEPIAGAKLYIEPNPFGNLAVGIRIVQPNAYSFYATGAGKFYHASSAGFGVDPAIGAIDFAGAGGVTGFLTSDATSITVGASGDRAIKTVSGGAVRTQLEATTYNFRAEDDNLQSLGTATKRWSNAFVTNLRPGPGASGVIWTTGAGTPEGAVVAPVGSLFTRTDGGASTTLYVKQSGAGNTGWVAK